MPTAVLLVSKHRADALSVDAGRRLAELGITGITVLGDERTLAVVLEGWAFDPTRATEAAEVLLPPRALPPVILAMQFHVTVRGGPDGGSP